MKSMTIFVLSLLAALFLSAASAAPAEVNVDNSEEADKEVDQFDGGTWDATNSSSPKPEPEPKNRTSGPDDRFNATTTVYDFSTSVTPEPTTTGVPSVKIVFYLKMSKSDFEKRKSDFITVLLKVLNGDEPAESPAAFFRLHGYMYAAKSRITEEDVTLEAKEVSSGVLEVIATIKTTKSKADLEKEVKEGEEEFKKAKFEVSITNPDKATEPPKKGLVGWQIALIVIACVVVVVIVIGIVYSVKKKRSRVDNSFGLQHFDK